MKLEIDNFEYDEIIKDILKNKEFKKLENYTHHKTTRLEHSKRVSIYSYKICKKLNLDFISAARGGMLHDFFYNKYDIKNSARLMKNHPKIALKNAKKHFIINKKEENIIESHMYPLNIKCKPKYPESLVVSIVDKIVCIYEKTLGFTTEFNFKIGKMAIFIFSYIFS